MRARYSAYVLGDERFIVDSWHPSTRPDSVKASDVEWHGLEVIRTTEGGAFDSAGQVEFRARFRRGDAHLELHELSTFSREGGRWYYVTGHDPEKLDDRSVFS